MKNGIELLSGPYDSEGDYSLVVVRNQGKVALGRKTRGFGHTKDGLRQLTLPGGKNHFYLGSNGIYLKPTANEAARETRQEIGISLRPEDIMPAGFLIVATEDDDKTISLFTATTRQEHLTDSDELTDLAWYSENDIPYSNTPADYAFWLPHVLNGHSVAAFLEMEEDVLLGGTVSIMGNNPASRGEVFPIPT